MQQAVRRENEKLMIVLRYRGVVDIAKIDTGFLLADAEGLERSTPSAVEVVRLPC